LSVIVKVKDPASGAEQEIELLTQENADIFLGNVAMKTECDQIEARLAELQIFNDPYRDLQVRISMLMDEMWPDTTAEGQLRQLEFERRFYETKLEKWRETQRNANSILLRAPGVMPPNGRLPKGFQKPGRG
jgi:hypothetical protein